MRSVHCTLILPAGVEHPDPNPNPSPNPNSLILPASLEHPDPHPNPNLTLTLTLTLTFIPTLALTPLNLAAGAEHPPAPGSARR